jgi:hypothetical protein
MVLLQAWQVSSRAVSCEAIIKLPLYNLKGGLSIGYTPLARMRTLSYEEKQKDQSGSEHCGIHVLIEEDKALYLHSIFIWCSADDETHSC